MPRSLFEEIIFKEAPGDEGEPPAEEVPSEEPPAEGDAPPDMGDDTGGDPDSPPDIGDAGMDMDITNTDDMSGGDDMEEPKISDKISSILNTGLYQQFLTLLNTVNSQISMLKGNNDTILSVSPEALGSIEPLIKLSENIKMYLSDNFVDTNYSKNVLVYSKCLNLLKLLNKKFEKELKKGHSGEE